MTGTATPGNKPDDERDTMLINALRDGMNKRCGSATITEDPEWDAEERQRCIEYANAINEARFELIRAENTVGRLRTSGNKITERIICGILESLATDVDYMKMCKAIKVGDTIDLIGIRKNGLRETIDMRPATYDDLKAMMDDLDSIVLSKGMAYTKLIVTRDDSYIVSDVYADLDKIAGYLDLKDDD